MHGDLAADPAPPDPDADAVLRTVQVSKVFPGVVALDEASLAVRAGEVHCLLGANGAGKSTLLKIIAGAQPPTRGTLILEGIPRRFRSPYEAAVAGISMIYQELDLVPQLSVEQNMLLGRVPTRFGTVDRAARRRIATAALHRVGARFRPDAIVGELSIAEQQLTAIARSLTTAAKVIVMDEPSAALNEHELERVFAVIRDLTAQGIAVLYVSHRMAEIREIGDRVTALRNGRTVDTFAVGAVSDAALVEAVLGRAGPATVARAGGNPARTTASPPVRPPAPSPAVLDVRRLDGPQGLRIRNLSVRAGEVVGLSGLNGSGRTTLLRALFGDLLFTGEVALRDEPFHPRRPSDAIRRGVALVPEDRKRQGLVLDAAIYRNAVLPALRRRRLLSHGAMRRTARPVLAQLSTRYGSLDQPVRTLSGGNQQKVVFAKWVVENSTMLLLDEPSRGLDVGAKAELYATVRRMAADGAAILVASSELEEIHAYCDRIWVLHEGRNVRCFDPMETDQDEILRVGLIGHDPAGEG